MGQPFIGEIRMFGGNFAPQDWALCDGSLLPISQYEALFALIGTIYGGDGQTTFALPDLRARAPLHQGQGPGLSNYAIGQMGGAETVSVTVNQMPAHRHQLVGQNAAGSQASPANGVWAASSLDQYTTSFSPPVPMAAGAVGEIGGSQPHNNMMPFVTINFIISLFGVFPSRS